MVSFYIVWLSKQIEKKNVTYRNVDASFDPVIGADSISEKSTVAALFFGQPW